MKALGINDENSQLQRLVRKRFATCVFLLRKATEASRSNVIEKWNGGMDLSLKTFVEE